LAAALGAGSVAMADIRLELIGQYQSGVFDESAAEINAFDPTTDQLFVVNANSGLIDVLDLSDPTAPSLVTSLDPAIANSAEVNSVDVHDGLLVAVFAADPKTDPGFMVFYNTSDLAAGPVAQFATGALPDMVCFSPDGNFVLSANEGEPNDDYDIDPEGSVTIVDLSNGLASATSVNLGWTGSANLLRAQGVRIFGPNATVAQDLEPEYIAVNDDSTVAYVVFQENNAIGLIDLETMAAGPIIPLGTKDHSLPGNGMDVSNRDGVINIATWPVKGFYMPDAAKYHTIGGRGYLFTANEGDSRDYDGYSEEERVKDVTLDATAFPDADMLQQDELLGRLNITLANGDIDGDGEYEELYSYGARSFSIWDAGGKLVWDSGDQFEQILADLKPANFNATNDENNFDNRSDDKGPEPEAIEIAALGDSIYAFIGLERVGGIMIYDVTTPTAPRFVGYETSRDFSITEDPDDSNIASFVEMGPEDVRFVAAVDSPNGKPLLIVSSEVSGSITIYEIKDRDTFKLTLLHANDPESQLVHAGSLQDDAASAPLTGFGGADGQFINFGGAARFVSKLRELRSDSEADGVLVLSAGDNFLPGLELNASNPEKNSANSEGVNYDALAIATADFDVSAVGNHEFDLGPNYLLDWYRQVRLGITTEGYEVYPKSDVAFVSANLNASAIPALDDFIAPSVVIEKSGERIGVIGATVWYLPSISSTGEVVMIDANGDGQSTIEDTAMLVQAQVDALEADGVNKIILVSHFQNVRNEQALVPLIRGVDVIVGGGGNNLLANDGDPVIAGRIPDGAYPLLNDINGQPVLDLDGVNVPVVETDGDFRYIGRLELEFDADGDLIGFSGGPERVSAFVDGVAFDDETLVNDGVEPDEFLLGAVQDPVFTFASVQFQTEVATSAVDLESRRAEADPRTGRQVGKRVAETNLGNLTADAVLWEGIRQADYLGTDTPVIGFQNGGGIRNDGVFPAGALTLGDVFNYLPFTNFNSVVEGITPEIFKQILEHSVSSLPDANGKFLQIAGFHYVYDVNRTAQVNDGSTITTPGERVRHVWLDDGTWIIRNGEIVDGAPTIAAATNSFVAAGGDGYYWLADLPRADAPSLYGDALINYVQTGLNGQINAEDYGVEAVGFRIMPVIDYTLDFSTGIYDAGWRASSYFGWLYVGSINTHWVFEVEQGLGWIYLAPSNTSPMGVWFFDTEAGWHYTTAEVYPWVYRFASGAWVALGAE
jgi:2',3'-cyclic-nucleotide 2'-phosphodiesterase (5'-nucleotidase family)